jgi:hypothetical protein
MLQENLKDAAQILQNILSQPLSISDTAENVSLLSAAQSFKTQDPLSSDLHNILATFHEYPGPTKTLITELQIMIHDLSV